ncbi:MAG TPA: hypothetical protein VK445_00280 [Dissulfurispiraceae bacterium]|nr:hypothetical protein [Dissulfurispiraceae bacterium]
MQQAQILRLLIAIDALLTMTGIVFEPVMSEDMPPALIAAYADAYPADNGGIALYMLALLILVLIGYIGMWRLRQWGRLAYTTACIVDISCLMFYRPVLLSGPAMALTVATGFVGGALLAMIWLSGLRYEFKE